VATGSPGLCVRVPERGGNLTVPRKDGMNKFKMWVFIKLIRSMGFNFIDIYAPDDENVVAITVTNDERYINRTAEIELLH
jgi:hypothetical protein